MPHEPRPIGALDNAAGSTAAEGAAGDDAKAPVRGRPFEKGGPSPNPGGRPKMPLDLRESFRITAPFALNTLIQIIRNPNHPHAERACEYIVDRAYGKPIAAMAIGNPDGSPLLGPNAGAPASDPFERLMAIVRGGATTAPKDSGTTEPESAAPGANGEAPGGRAA